MARMTSLEHSPSRKIRDSYLQLGLEPGPSVHESGTAYWRFVRELQGQTSMAPYTAAHEALVTRFAPRRNGVRPAALVAPADTPTRKSTLVFNSGWPGELAPHRQGSALTESDKG